MLCAVQIVRFQSLDACLYEGDSASDRITYCYSSADLYAVNPRGPLAGSPTATEAVSRALCVEKKNYVFPVQYNVLTDACDGVVMCFTFVVAIL